MQQNMTDGLTDSLGHVYVSRRGQHLISVFGSGVCAASGKINLVARSTEKMVVRASEGEGVAFSEDIRERCVPSTTIVAKKNLAQAVHFRCCRRLFVKIMVVYIAVTPFAVRRL